MSTATTTPAPRADAAPDGARMTIDDPGSPELWGSWERQADTWVPILSPVP